LTREKSYFTLHVAQKCFGIHHQTEGTGWTGHDVVLCSTPMFLTPLDFRATNFGTITRRGEEKVSSVDCHHPQRLGIAILGLCFHYWTYAV